MEKKQIKNDTDRQRQFHEEELHNVETQLNQVLKGALHLSSRKEKRVYFGKYIHKKHPGVHQVVVTEHIIGSTESVTRSKDVQKKFAHDGW
jgi:hypothetical protein